MMLYFQDSTLRLSGNQDFTLYAKMIRILNAQPVKIPPF